MELKLKSIIPADLRSGAEGQDRISLYMPTHPESRSNTIEEDSIRLKNILHKIESNPAIRVSDTADKSLRRVWDLIDDADFWRHQKYGLALFVDPDRMRYVKLPYEVNVIHSVDDSFVLAPLHIMQKALKNYFLLEINLDRPKLFRVDVATMEQIEDSNLPKNIEDALRLDEFQKNQQFHTGASRGRAMYHGHGAADDNKDVDINNYLHLLAKRADTFLQKYSDPLILAGTKERVAHVRSLLRYKHTLDKEIRGNHESPRTIPALQKEVRSLLESIQDDERTKALQRFEEARGNGLAAEGMDNVMSASSIGNVDHLFVEALRQTRDSVQEENVAMKRYEFPEDISMLEKVVSSVKAQAGEITATYKENNGQPSSKINVKAILRYNMSR